MLNFKGVLCISHTNPLSDNMLCKYFLPICGLSFHSLNIVFHGQKYLILIKLRLPVLFFMDHAFGFLPKNFWPNPWLPDFLLYFLLKLLLFLHWIVQLSHHHLLKTLSFLHWVAFLLFKYKLTVFAWAYFQALCSFPLNCKSILWQKPCCLN